MGRRVLTALGLVGLLALDAQAIEVVGSNTAHFSWAPASGPVIAYLVYVSRNGQGFGDYPEQIVREPRADVEAAPGDNIVVAVSAASRGGPPGPLSQLSYPVRFSAIQSPPAISTSQSRLFFHVEPGIATPSPTLSVVNSGGGSLDFEISSFTPWLRATPSAGKSAMADVPVSVSIDPTGLPPGDYFSALTIRAAGIPTPVRIPVTLNVLPEIPVFSLSSRRVSVTAELGNIAQAVHLTLNSTDPGAEYSVTRDASIINLPSETAALENGQATVSFDVDPDGVARGVHSGRVYVIPADPRAAILPVDVTLTVVDPTAPPRMGPDLNGDLRADLVWRDSVTGDVQIWLMNGAVRLGSARLVGLAPASEWSLAALGDLDGDRRADLIWQNARTGAAVAWIMNGLTRTRLLVLPPATGGGWQIVSADDVNGDGRADLIEHHPASGRVQVRFMNGAVQLGTLTPESAGEFVATVIGSGDFDATGTADLVWRTAGGEHRIWLSENGTSGHIEPLNGVPEAGWSIAGIADQDGDGKSDVIWRNPSLREAQLWRFESPTLIDLGPIASVRRPGWNLVQTADFDGDGASDLLWRNASTGQATFMRMEGFELRQSGNLVSPPPVGWEIQP